MASRLAVSGQILYRLIIGKVLDFGMLDMKKGEMGKILYNLRKKSFTFTINF